MVGIASRMRVSSVISGVPVFVKGVFRSARTRTVREASGISFASAATLFLAMLREKHRSAMPLVAKVSDSSERGGIYKSADLQQGVIITSYANVVYVVCYYNPLLTASKIHWPCITISSMKSKMDPELSSASSLACCIIPIHFRLHSGQGHWILLAVSAACALIEFGAKTVLRKAVKTEGNGHK